MLQGEHCEAATIEAFLSEGRLDAVAAGAPVAWAGQPMSDLVLVVQGALEVSRVGVDGRRHVTSFPGPGQWFGLIPIIDGQAAVHDAWAHGDALLLCVPRASFLRCLDADRLLNRTTMLRLCQRSRLLYDALADDGLLPLRARTARALERIAIGFPQPPGSGLRMRIAVSQDVIADMLGVTRQSANQELKQLERDGLITLGRGVVELLDRERLRAFGRR
jgi:CRP/FNR family cyclic AMP-dependent transcriptional regulator